MDPQTDQNPKQQLVERLKSATNILVTVSTDPSVDQLAACIGLTLWLNKMGKHATAVFSGEVPSTLEFLQPEETLEKNTDSLRDFIISLDKSKADKLRYKVEDRVVKIFITPYRTNLSAADLEFSQGDFNVDAILALGVAEQQDLDNAITGHGRILHDATVMSINTAPSGGLGSVNWHDTGASSLCELVVDVGNELGKDQLDSQIATALLTGIVAETDRFSNEKTLPQTMSVSAELMTAGANQQLVASKLEGPSLDLHGNTPAVTDEPADDAAAASDDGTLEIGHKHEEPEQAEVEASSPQEPPEAEEAEGNEADEPAEENSESHLINADKAAKLVTEPPALGGTLTANSAPERPEQEPATDPLSTAAQASQPLLNHEEAVLPATEEPKETGTEPPHWQPPAFLQNATPVEDPVATEPEPAPTVEPVSETSAPEPEQTPPEAPEPEVPEADSKETLTEIEASVGAHQTASEVPDTAEQTELAESARNNLDDVYATHPPASLPNPAAVLDAAMPAEAAVPTEPPALAPEPQPAAPSVAFDPSAFGVINDPDTQPVTPQPLTIPGAATQPGMVEPPQDPASAPPVPPPLPPSMYQPAPSDQDKAA